MREKGEPKVRLRVTLLIGRCVRIEGPDSWEGGGRVHGVVLRPTDLKALSLIRKRQVVRRGKTGPKPRGTFLVSEDGTVTRVALTNPSTVLQATVDCVALDARRFVEALEGTP